MLTEIIGATYLPGAARRSRREGSETLWGRDKDPRVLSVWEGCFDLGEKATALEGLAGALTAEGRSESAVRLFATAAAVREATGAVREVPAEAAYDRDLAVTRAALGEAAFAATWTSGWAMGLEGAVAEALAPDPSPGPLA